MRGEEGRWHRSEKGEGGETGRSMCPWLWFFNPSEVQCTRNKMQDLSIRLDEF